MTAELLAAGQHAEALRASEGCLVSSSSQPPAVKLTAARLHELRGRSYEQLGDLAQAVAECSAGIQLASALELNSNCVGPRALLAQLLQARASVYQQQEKLTLALEDIEQAVKLQDKPALGLLLAEQRLRRACRLLCQR
jgi:tetratricopeptide (TPR) repeat protein